VGAVWNGWMMSGWLVELIGYRLGTDGTRGHGSSMNEGDAECASVREVLSAALPLFCW
jgi:hypothetical protein